MLSASDVFELEKKVFQYRLKKNIKKFSIALSIVISFIGIFFAYTYLLKSTTTNHIASEMNENEEKNISIVKPQSLLIKEETVTTSVALAPIQEKSPEINTTLPAPNLSQEETLMLKSPKVTTGKEYQSNTYLAPPKQENIKPLTSLKDNQEETFRKNSFNNDEIFYRNVEEKIDTTVLAPPLLEESKPKGVIKIETQEVNSLQYLKEKFEKTNNIIFALMLAEEFYNNKNYVESNKWALIANHLDSDNEKSWLWFAKSKLKLGQKEDAIVALKAYLKTNKSKIAQTLLNQITMGDLNE